MFEFSLSELFAVFGEFTGFPSRSDIRLPHYGAVSGFVSRIHVSSRRLVVLVDSLQPGSQPVTVGVTDPKLIKQAMQELREGMDVYFLVQGHPSAFPQLGQVDVIARYWVAGFDLDVPVVREMSLMARVTQITRSTTIDTVELLHPVATPGWPSKRRWVYGRAMLATTVEVIGGQLRVDAAVHVTASIVPFRPGHPGGDLLAINRVQVLELKR